MVQQSLSLKYVRVTLVWTNFTSCRYWAHTQPIQKQMHNSEIVGALSPVNHEGLRQGWKQDSTNLQVIHSTNHYTTGLFFSNHNSNSIHDFGMQPRKTMTQLFRSLFIFHWHSTMQTQNQHSSFPDRRQERASCQYTKLPTFSERCTLESLS